MPIGAGASLLGAAQARILMDLSDLNRATVQTAQAGREIEQNLGVINRGATQAQGGVTALVGGFGRLSGVIGTVGLALGAFGVQSLGRTAVEMTRVSAVTRDMRDQFTFMAGVSEQESERMMQAMRKASKGMISDTELVASANRAMMFQVADSQQDLVQLLEITNALAGTMGITTTQAFDDLVRGIGRLSPLILDNLGLTIDTERAYTEYAAVLGKSADELTQTEQRQAFLNEALKQAQPLMARQAELGQTNADKLQEVQRAAENAQLAMGNAIQDDVIRATETYVWLLERITELLDQMDSDPTRETGPTAPLSEFLFGDLNREYRQVERDLTNYRLLLDRAEEGLARLRADAGTPLFDIGALRRQVDLVRELREEVERLERSQAGIYTALELDRPAFGPRMRPPGALSPLTGDADAGASAGGAGPDLNRLRELQVDFWRDTQQIEEDAQNARRQAVESYEQQVSSVQRSYQTSMLRSEEDFQRSRARQIADHEKAIGQLHAAAAERRVTWDRQLEERIADLRATHNERRTDAETDLAERLADAREEGAARIADIERSIQEDRERALRNHRNSLLDAASRLDARAVAQEMRRFRVENEERERAAARQLAQTQQDQQERIEQEQAAFDKRWAREARDLQKRIDQEREAHAERLAEAAAADAKRLEQMKADFEERLAQDDEERQIWLDRQREDHESQLAELARNHDSRMIQINRQETDRLEALKDSFEDQLSEFGYHNDDWRDEQAEHQRKATRLFNDMWDDWEWKMNRVWESVNENVPPWVVSPGQPLVYAPGNAPETNSYWPQPSTTNNSSAVTVQEGAIQIQVPNSVDPQTLAALLVELLGEVAGEQSPY